MERYHASEQTHNKKQRIIYDGHQVEEDDDEDEPLRQEGAADAMTQTDTSTDEEEIEDEPPLQQEVVLVDAMTQTDMSTDSEDEEEQKEAWLSLMHMVFGDHIEIITKDTSRDFMALNRLRARLNAMDRTVELIQQSAPYQAIEKEKDMLLERKYDEDEADQMAWLNRRYLVVNYLSDIIQDNTVQD
jgi:hypothetical protein